MKADFKTFQSEFGSGTDADSYAMLVDGPTKPSERAVIIKYPRTVFPYEEKLLRFIQSFASPALDVFAVFCAYLIWPDLLLMITFFLMLADPAHMIPFAIFWGLQELWNGLVKWIFQNPRPYCIYPNVRLLRTTVDEGSSFPSSHAQCFAFAAIALPMTYGWNFWTIPMVPLCIFGGLTRVYLGVHFLHDVLVGWVFAAIWSVIYYYNSSLQWWFELDEIKRIIYFSVFFLGVPLTFFWVKNKYPSPDQDDIHVMLERANENCNDGRKVSYRKREFHSYLYTYAIIIGVLIGFEIQIRHHALTYFSETYGHMEIIYPRIAIGVMIPIILVGLFEVMKELESLRSLGSFWRLFILSIPMIAIGLFETFIIPNWSEDRGWVLGDAMPVV